MNIVESIKEMQALSLSWKRAGFKVGVVPTMGALHEGHLSLIDQMKKYVDKVVVTLFVNPTQFGAGEDFSKYPRTFEQDASFCKERGAAALFVPAVEEMYPADCSTFVEEQMLTVNLCGASRPGHFRGVTSVVAKLYNAVLPDYTIFGEKDFQQLAVLRRMTRDLNFPIEVLAAPIFREQNGLAMSSRNRYLSEAEREAAAIIFKALSQGVKEILAGSSFSEVIQVVSQKISQAGGRIDYIKIVDSETLEDISAKVNKPMRILLAAFFGPARLIDNLDVK